MPSQISIRRFHALMAAIVLLPTILIGVITVAYVYRLQRQTLATEVRALTQLAAGATDEIVGRWARTLEREIAQPGIDPARPVEAAAILELYFLHHSRTLGVSLIDGDGRIIARAGLLDDAEIKAAADAMGLPGALPPHGRVSGLLRTQYSGMSVIGIAVPARSVLLTGPVLPGGVTTSNGPFLLAFHFPSDLAAVIPRDNDAPRGWQAALVDQNNVAIVHSSPDRAGKSLANPTSLFAPAQAEGASVYVSTADPNFVAAVRQSRVAPWRVIYCVPTNGFYRFVDRPSFDGLVLLALLILPVSASMQLGRYLGRRIERLAGLARRVDSEDAPMHIKPTGLTEIDVVQTALSDAHNAMLQRARGREKLRDTEIALQRALRMESMGQVLAGIAHDFGNMIFTLRGQLEILRRGLAANADAQQQLAPAIHLVNEASALLTDLKSSSRQERASGEYVDVNQVLAEAAELLHQVAGRSIQVVIVPAPVTIECHLDPTLLKSALLNLVLNARNAMPDGGEIHIGTDRLALNLEEAKARNLRVPGSYAAISVSDTGPGIAPELRARIFEPFVSSRGEKSGNGLGLSIIYGFVTSSGGQIFVESELNRGTTFTMLFPAHVEPAGNAASADAYGQ